MVSRSSAPLIRYRSRGLDILELWFDEEMPTSEKPDIIRHKQALTPPSARATDFFTLITDLTPDEDALFAGMSKDTRYNIRRAEQLSDLVYEVRNPEYPNFFDEFASYYDEFARQKGLPPINVTQLQRLERADRLDLSRIRDRTGKILVYHAHYRHHDRVRLLYSASHFRDSDERDFRTLVGRANRLLHWLDMRRFKAADMRTYDWGGWYEGKDNKALRQVNAFKEAFGGVLTHTYNDERLLTLKARLFNAVSRMLRRR
jgi:hypothetical protein